MAKAKKRTAARRSTARRAPARKSTPRRVVAQRAASPSKSKTNNASFAALANTFIITFAVSASVAYLANLFFPMHVVLGTADISPFWAIVYSMGALALVTTTAVPFMNKLEEWKGRPLTSMEWMFQYLVLNFTALYVLTRASQTFGMGVSTWLVVLLLAVALDFFQGMAMMQASKLQGK